MVPLGPKCNTSEKILYMFYCCYLGISVEDRDDAYVLEEE